MFVAHNKVRMNDTDMAGILYFANQFRFAHDALEDIFNAEGYSIASLLEQEGFLLAIVHAEADYLAPLQVGDSLEVHVSIVKMGTTSVAFQYDIYRHPQQLVGTAKTVHVCLDSVSRSKISLPESFRQKFAKYLALG